MRKIGLQDIWPCLDSVLHKRVGRIYLLVALASALLLGCASNPKIRAELHVSEIASPSELSAAVEVFYGARSVEELEVAVQRALTIAPRSAEAHSIAAILERYKGDSRQEYAHLEAALLDTTNRWAELHLDRLQRITLDSERATHRLGLLSAIESGHPNRHVRNLATEQARTLRGYLSGKAEQEPIEANLPLRWIGTWDNDQGKGFDEELPPEKYLSSGSMDMESRYPGPVVEIGWRENVPRTPSGNYDLESLFTPSRWALAYGYAILTVPESGSYLLDVKTTDPLKIWINGALGFAASDLDRGWAGPGMRIPVSLSKGMNQILIKSAQEEGGWGLRVALRDTEGRHVSGVELEPAGASSSIPKDLRTSQFFELKRIVEIHAGPEDGVANRRAAALVRWATVLGAKQLALSYAEQYESAAPESLIAKLMLLESLQSRGESGRVADIFSDLGTSDAMQLDGLGFLQARAWIRQGFRRKARTLLEGVVERYPELAKGWMELAVYFQAEGWTEDRCTALRKAQMLAPAQMDVRLSLGKCLGRAGFAERSWEIFERLRQDFPGHPSVLARLRDSALEVGDLRSGVAILKSRLNMRPDRYQDWIFMAALYRRLGNTEQAKSALKRALDIDPDSPSAYFALGRLAYEQGDKEGAVKDWKKSVERDPDNDRLALRLSYLEPREDEPWLKDVVSDKRIAEILRDESSGAASEGADVTVLLSQEVGAVHADGSRSGVVTRLVRIENDRGRDKLTRVPLFPAGRKRMLSSYALNPSGTRIEASALRENVIRFRGLDVGAIVVLQFRYDAGPDPYLAQYYSRTQPFQLPGVFTAKGEWILWVPEENTVHHKSFGAIAGAESEKEGFRRFVWSARDLEPIIPEPNMPYILDVVARVVVSTVPSWETFLQWEAALLREVFEESSAIRMLARKLIPEGIDNQEKVLRIHRYVQEEIRYEQDYENTIAGVKPHSAPVVFARRYGDCKDKTVLFIALARLAGVKARFAILRTTGKGTINKEIPMQQFNHAIVYVPEQEGISEARFYDPTADGLDLDVLRADDVGAWAFIFDPEEQSSEWQLIPIPEPDVHKLRIGLELSLRSDGSAQGRLEMDAKGTSAAALRKFARNAKLLDKFVDSMTGRIFSGGVAGAKDAVEVTSLRDSARISWAFDAPNVARKKGKKLVWTPPVDSIGRSSAAFSLPERRYPLKLGVPRMEILNISIKAPSGWKIREFPKTVLKELSCFSMDRQVRRKGQTLEMTFRRSLKCNELSPEDYLMHRGLAEEIDRLFDDETVLAR